MREGTVSLPSLLQGYRESNPSWQSGRKKRRVGRLRRRFAPGGGYPYPHGPVNRIEQIFADQRAAGRRGLVAYYTPGDPDLASSERLLGVIGQAGASVCELGIPFSDPIADGPVIQASMTHALAQGVRPIDVLAMVARQRAKLSMGLVAMVSYSIVYRLGMRSFFRDARQAGIDGFILPDLTLEESGEARDALAQEDLTCGLLIAPTTPQPRAEKIAAASSGFVYLLARSGITGERDDLPADLTQRIERLRCVTDLPIAVGFGIGTAQQVRQVVKAADAAIVGSAIVRRIGEYRDRPEKMIQEVGRFVEDLTTGLTGS